MPLQSLRTAAVIHQQCFQAMYGGSLARRSVHKTFCPSRLTSHNYLQAATLAESLSALVAEFKGRLLLNRGAWHNNGKQTAVAIGTATGATFRPSSALGDLLGPTGMACRPRALLPLVALTARIVEAPAGRSTTGVRALVTAMACTVAVVCARIDAPGRLRAQSRQRIWWFRAVCAMNALFALVSVHQWIALRCW